MKIFIAIIMLGGGGVQRVASALSVEWQTRHKHKVVFAVSDPRQPSYVVGGEIRNLGIAFPDKSTHGDAHAQKMWDTVKRVFPLVRLLRRESPDYIIGFEEHMNFPLIIAALLTGNLGRTQVSVHFSPSHFHWTKRLFARLLYPLAGRVVTVSYKAKRQLVDMGLPADKIIFIPNSAPAVLEKIPPHPKPKLGRYILAVGRLDKQKGFDMLLAAFAKLKITDTHLVILGDGEERESLTALIKMYGLEKRVLMPGYVNNPESWYSHAEMYVMSSRYEGWPLSIPEAMAHGCPVISFACPTGPDEIIQHGKNGLLVANGNVTALSVAIADLLADKRRRAHLATGGKKRVADFAIDKIAPKWLK